MSHWYTATGEPMHWVIGADGKERDTTLRDARKLNLRPSVTEIINILAKPGLERWKQEQLLYAALTTPRPEDITDNEFLKLVRQDAAQEAEQAKLRGTVIHNCMEHLWKKEMFALRDFPEDVVEICNAAMELIIGYTDCDDFTAEKTVAGDGYGGMIDLSNDDFALDYKGKDLTDQQWDGYENGRNPRLAYPDHAMQLAAYDRALSISRHGTKPGPGRRCINVFIDRTEPGKVIIHEWKPEEIAHAWLEFEHCLKLWQLKKHYVPE